MPRAVVGGLTSAARQVQGRTSAQCLQPSRRCSAAHVTAASFCIGGVHVLSGGSHFTLWMMFVTHLISVPRRRVGHGGMDSQVLRGSFSSCRRICLKVHGGHCSTAGREATPSTAHTTADSGKQAFSRRNVGSTPTAGAGHGSAPCAVMVRLIIQICPNELSRVSEIGTSSIPGAPFIIFTVTSSMNAPT